MTYSKFLALLCLVICFCSCSTENTIPEIEEEALLGHWNITVPSGLQFIEFISNGRVLMGDRGALGTMDVSQHYLHTYQLNGVNGVEGLPSESRMDNVIIEGDRMTFDFINPQTGYKMPYTAYREDKFGEGSPVTSRLNQVWVTTEQDGQPITEQNKKTAYFSKAGIYALTNPSSGVIDMFSWDWSNDSQDELCYSRYQRPTMVPQETCMKFKIITSEVAIFEVGNLTLRLESSVDF